MQYLKPLLTLNYWFNLNPAPFIPLVWDILGGLIIFLFVASAVVKYLSLTTRKNPPLHRILSRAGRAGLWVSVIALVFYFFNFEGLSMLSARFWWVLLAIASIVWKIIIFIDFKKHYAVDRKAFLEKKEKEKYL
jgi:hypothetical protein